MDFEVAEVNGAAGLLIRDGGKLTAVATVELRDGVFCEVHAVVNPDKRACATRQLAGTRL